MERPISDRARRTPGLAVRVEPGLSPLAKSKALFFLAAGLSFLLSVYLFFSGDHERGIFVGIWVPSILSAGALLLSGARHE
jgi:hypothetical protein